MSIINFIKECGLIIVFQLVRFFVGLRYKIKVKGLENLEPLKGAVILPNHPAEIDPVFIILALWKKLRPRPLVVEHFYYLKGFRFFMDWVGARPFPNLDTGANKWKVKQLEKLFSNVIEDLKRGENFLVYPSGRLKLTGQEVIGGASFVPKLIQEYPEVNIVLVRTSGLWGSRFSRAITGKVPDFGSTLLEGFKILLKNGIFFTPRREVIIEVEAVSADFPKTGTRMEINRYLETWYNKKGIEPRILISDKFWTRSIPKITALEKNAEEGVKIPPEMEKEILAEIASLTKRPEETIEKNMHFSFDLGLDSLDAAQLYIFLDEKYGISNLVPGQLQTVEDVMKAAAGYKKEQNNDHANKKTIKWPQEKNRCSPEQPWGETIAEAFLHSCQRMGNTTACADNLSLALSYKKLKQAALILSMQFRKLPGAHIGVLLPSSVGANVVVLGILLAKKIPVMLNWTTGVRALNHAVHMTDLKSVISSQRFLSRLENADLGDVEEKLLYLEEIREQISLKDKIKGFLLSKKKSAVLLSKLKLDQIKSQDTAVIIFTSGTEALPKGVPLSHQNLLSNLKSAFQCVAFKRHDILYGVLPPFHSFGFSVTGIFPLLSGIKVIYGPDPTDSHGMVSDIAHWNPTLLVCAPSFIRSLFRVAKPESLSSLRLIVSGAEKAPQELFDAVANLGKDKIMIEGYGITECSPIVTLNRPNKPHRGVGLPLPGISLKTIDIQTQNPLPQGEEGEICVSGPSIFPGYLSGTPNPFIEFEGKKWYRSGDYGSIDQDGYLLLSGRLKRFVKIGGEMISLGGVEEELIKAAKTKGWVQGVEEPYFAVSAKEKGNEKPQIVLYTTVEIEKEVINTFLNESGFGRLTRIGEVCLVDVIPVTGTGKIHHRVLDEKYGNKSGIQLGLKDA